MSHSPRLPLLGEKKRELETCGYCPKLCRAACPVSNAEPRETLTPWGKMSASWFCARGDLPASLDHSYVAWACTGCHNCRHNCDHKNPVAEVLATARSDFYAAGVAPETAYASASRHAERLRRLSVQIERLTATPAVDPHAGTALLIGCGYTLHAAEEAEDALQAVAALVGPVRLLRRCCGVPLLAAGDRLGFEAEQRALFDELGSSELVAVDPGCALALGERRPVTLVELAAGRLERLERVSGLGDTEPLRWQDPCQLGRGLGLFAPPRAVLIRALGRAPDEFARNREAAVCTGGGGLLPVTMPEISGRIAERRIAEHEGSGGGRIVTGCGAGLRRLRASGASAVDIATVIRRSIGVHG